MISAALEAVIEFYNGSLHDINHVLKVYAYARTIGQLEGLDAATQRQLELGAIFHDIACPLCRAKYGRAAGPDQQREGPALARPLLQRLGCEPALTERICWLIAHHHTYTDVDGADHQILLEADYLVNACESGYSPSAIAHARASFFRTAAGLRLLDSIYLRPQTGAGQ